MARHAAALEPLDDDHAAAAARTWLREGLWLAVVSRGILVETEPGLFAQPHP